MAFNRIKIVNKILSTVFIISYCNAKSVTLGPPTAKSSLKKLPSLTAPLISVAITGKSKECIHESTTFGERVPGDLQTFVQVVKKDKGFFRKTTVQVQYPSRNTKNDCAITFINVVNLYKGCNCFKDSISITDGGIGEKYFKLSITSEAFCPTEYKISCFTKCG